MAEQKVTNYGAKGDKRWTSEALRSLGLKPERGPRSATNALRLIQKLELDGPLKIDSYSKKICRGNLR